MTLEVTASFETGHGKELRVERVTDPRSLEVKLASSRRWKRAVNVPGWEVVVRRGRLVVYVGKLAGRQSVSIRLAEQGGKG